MTWPLLPSSARSRPRTSRRTSCSSSPPATSPSPCLPSTRSPELTRPVHSSWTKARDISTLSPREITAYVGNPGKKNGDLLKGYKVAEDPKSWIADREENDQLRADEAARAAEHDTEDQLASGDEANGDKSKKRKRKSDAGAAKKEPEDKKAKKAKLEKLAKNRVRSRLGLGSGARVAGELMVPVCRLAEPRRARRTRTTRLLRRRVGLLPRTVRTRVPRSSFCRTRAHSTVQTRTQGSSRSRTGVTSFRRSSSARPPSRPTYVVPRSNGWASPRADARCPVAQELVKCKEYFDSMEKFVMTKEWLAVRCVSV